MNQQEREAFRQHFGVEPPAPRTYKHDDGSVWLISPEMSWGSHQPEGGGDWVRYPFLIDKWECVTEKRPPFYGGHSQYGPLVAFGEMVSAALTSLQA